MIPLSRPRDWPYLAMIVFLVVAVCAFTIYIAFAPLFHDDPEPQKWSPATIAPAVPYQEEPEER